MQHPHLENNKDHGVSLEKLYSLLRIEYENEKKTFERDTALMGVGRKVKRGDCWLPVTLGRSYYNSLNRFVVEVSRSEDTDIEHNFEYGKQVCFFSQDATGGLHFFTFRATVSYAEADRMVVELPSEAALAQLQGMERLGVQLHFDDYSYRVMFDAMHRVIEAKNNRLATLRDIFHGQIAPSWGTPSAIQPSFPWLNASQQQAVRDVLVAKDVLIVHGPPGTGKTTTLVEAISEVLRREPQVMVCAQSNTAVDWICEQIGMRGISVLRIGNPSRITESMLANTYEHRFEQHPDYPDLWQIRRTIRQLYSLPRKGRDGSFHQKIARLRERADELEMRIRHSLFNDSRVIASTLTGAANALLVGQHFHTLFIDEAAQALEPACWVAIAKADRVVFAGDHQQLPPTVKSVEAMRGGLSHTLMQQVAEHCPAVVRLLKVQYRMNETLMRFSSDWFYGGQLEAAPEVKHRSLLDDIDAPLMWIDTDKQPLASGDNETILLDNNIKKSLELPHHEQFIGNNYGRINCEEALLTLQVLHQYVARMGCRRLLEERVDFGIISPYRAQVQLLRSLIRRDDKLRPLRSQIMVNTVDAFQGQERDVMLVSLVRANEEGQIGFLSDYRRMNVAITRARFKLIILGSVSTLCSHKFYKTLYESCVKATEN